MKLLRFGTVGQEKPGVLRDDGRAVDVSSWIDDYGPAFFEQHDSLARLAQRVADEGERLPTVSLEGQRLGAPIARPHKLICIGLNYADHAAESNMPLPPEPIVFGKGTNTIIGPNDTVMIPRQSIKTDWEVELAVVVAKTARYLPDEEAAQAAIAGYAISNDVSERAFQLERGGQWIKGKSCETFNPLGPWLVTADEVSDPQQLNLGLRVNGVEMQHGSTSTMVFSAAHIVWYLSHFMVLEPGDVINTGTPPGVGMGMRPQRFLAEDDVMEVWIEGLGEQRQVCIRA